METRNQYFNVALPAVLVSFIFTTTPKFPQALAFIGDLISGVTDFLSDFIPWPPWDFFSIFRSAFDWFVNLIATGFLDAVGYFFVAGVEMFLIFDNPRGVAPLNDYFMNSLILYLFIIFIATFGYYLVFMFYPSEAKIDIQRMVERVIISAILLFISRDVYAFFVELTNEITLFIFPQGYTYEVALDLTEVAMVTVGSGIAAMIVAVFGGLAVLIGGLLFYLLLATRMLIIYMVYALLPIIIALWTIDVGPGKYGKNIADLLMRLAAAMMVFGIIVASMLAVGHAFGQSQDVGAEGATDITDGGTVVQSSDPFAATIGADIATQGATAASFGEVMLDIFMFMGVIWLIIATGTSLFGVMMSASASSPGGTGGYHGHNRGGGHGQGGGQPGGQVPATHGGGAAGAAGAGTVGNGGMAPQPGNPPGVPLTEKADHVSRGALSTGADIASGVGKGAKGVAESTANRFAGVQEGYVESWREPLKPDSSYITEPHKAIPERFKNEIQHTKDISMEVGGVMSTVTHQGFKALHNKGLYSKPGNLKVESAVGLTFAGATAVSALNFYNRGTTSAVFGGAMKAPKTALKGGNLAKRGGKAYWQVFRQPTVGGSIGEAHRIARESPIAHPGGPGEKSGALDAATAAAAGAVEVAGEVACKPGVSTSPAAEAGQEKTKDTSGSKTDQTTVDDFNTDTDSGTSGEDSQPFEQPDPESEPDDDVDVFEDDAEKNYIEGDDVTSFVGGPNKNTKEDSSNIVNHEKIEGLKAQVRNHTVAPPSALAHYPYYEYYADGVSKSLDSIEDIADKSEVLQEKGLNPDKVVDQMYDQSVKVASDLEDGLKSRRARDHASSTKSLGKVDAPWEGDVDSDRVEKIADMSSEERAELVKDKAREVRDTVKQNKNKEPQQPIAVGFRDNIDDKEFNSEEAEVAYTYHATNTLDNVRDSAVDNKLDEYNNTTTF